MERVVNEAAINNLRGIVQPGANELFNTGKWVWALSHPYHSTRVDFSNIKLKKTLVENYLSSFP